MEQSQDAKLTDRQSAPERSEPIPLAERRRSLRPDAQPVQDVQEDQVFTDWAAF